MKKYFVIILLILATISFGGFYLFVKLNSNEENKWIERQGNANTIEVGINKKKYNCVVNTCSLISSSSAKEDIILIEDAGYYFYDFKINKALKINIKEKFDRARIIMLDNDLYGVILAKNGKESFYLVNDEKMYLENKYTTLEISETLARKNYISAYDEKNETIYLIDLFKDKIVYSKKSDGFNTYFDLRTYNNQSYYVLGGIAEDEVISNIYDENFNEITIKNNDAIKDYSWFGIDKILANGNILFKLEYNDQKNSYVILDNHNNIVSQTKRYDNIRSIEDNYYLTFDNDGEVNLLDKNEKNIKTITIPKNSGIGCGENVNIFVDNDNNNEIINICITLNVDDINNQKSRVYKYDIQNDKLNYNDYEHVLGY